jgi:hypothetical protein
VNCGAVPFCPLIAWQAARSAADEVDIALKFSGEHGTAALIDGQNGSLH